MFAHENPFRTERLGALAYRHPELGLDAIEARWRALGCRGAVVGPHGSGKTTLLRALGDRFVHQGARVVRWTLRVDGPRPRLARLVREARHLGPGEVLLFDGAGHLSALAWWCVARACRRAGGVLVTAHAESRLPTLLRTRTDRALLAELVRELLGPGADALAPLLEELRVTHHGNLRDVFLALYDLAARGDPRLVAG